MLKFILHVQFIILYKKKKHVTVFVSLNTVIQRFCALLDFEIALRNSLVPLFTALKWLHFVDQDSIFVNSSESLIGS